VQDAVQQPQLLLAAQIQHLPQLQVDIVGADRRRERGYLLRGLAAIRARVLQAAAREPGALLPPPPPLLLLLLRTEERSVHCSAGQGRWRLAPQLHASGCTVQKTKAEHRAGAAGYCRSRIITLG
jgi:hypothetical protein